MVSLIVKYSLLNNCSYSGFRLDEICKFWVSFTCSDRRLELHKMRRIKKLLMQLSPSGIAHLFLIKLP